MPSVLSRATILLTLLSLFIIAHRTYWTPAPFQRDISTYAVVGHEILQGRALYSDIWDHKPPAIHLSYAVAESLGGYHPWSVHILGLLASIITLIAIFRIVDHVADSSAALFAASLWALLAGDLLLEAYQPNTEAFINAFVVSAIALSLPNAAVVRQFLRMCFAGILLGIATLYKQIAFIPFAGFFVGCLLATSSEERRNQFKNIFPLAAGALIPWTVILTYFYSVGSLPDFYDAVFIYNNFYSGSLLENLISLFSFSHLLPRCVYALIPLFLLSIIGAYRGMPLDRNRTWWMVLGFFAGAVVAVALPGRFYNHYYQLLVPPLCLGAGLSVKYLPKIIPGITLAILILYESWFFKHTPLGWSLRKHGKVYVDSQEAGENIRAKDLSGGIFLWGSDTGIFFYSRHSPVSGVFYALPLLEGPLMEKLGERTMTELIHKRPRYVIIDGKTAGVTPQTHPIRHWIERNYFAKEQLGVYTLLERNAD